MWSRSASSIGATKLATTTLNLAAGEAVKEIEVFEVRLNAPQLDEAVLRQIDKEIPYHILFILTYDGKAQAWIGYKEAAAFGGNAFKVILSRLVDTFSSRILYPMLLLSVES